MVKKKTKVMRLRSGKIVSFEYTPRKRSKRSPKQIKKRMEALKMSPGMIDMALKKKVEADAREKIIASLKKHIAKNRSKK